MKKQDKEYFHQKMKRSYELFEKGKKVLATFYTTGLYDDILFFESGKGSKIYDPDGNEYIDYAMGLGPLILGHSHSQIVEAVCETVKKGMVHGIGHELEIKFAEMLVEAIPCADMVTFTNSGTEATMHALKCARAYTKKEKIAKFEGHYHGTHDYAQISGRHSTLGPVEDPISNPDFSGIPKWVVDNVLTLSLNQPETFDKIRKNKDELAAVILEPIPLYCPLDCSEFIRELREVTRQNNIVLIFDEVITGFRLGFHGAQGYYDVIPDLATYGKIVGGGLPVGVIAGSYEYMSPFCFNGYNSVKSKVYNTGTFSGNMPTCAAGIAAIQFLKNNPQVYAEMENKANTIRTAIETYAKKIKFPFQTKGIASWFVPYFTFEEIKKPRDAKWSTTSHRYDNLRKQLLKYGINVGDAGALFLSVAHTDEDCAKTIEAFKLALNDLM